MAEYLVLGMGSPSDMGAFTREYASLEGMTPSDYAKSKGVKVLPKPATLSCHNTPDRPHPFAVDLESIADNYDADNNANKVVAVLGGGMSLQLPAIVASHTRTVPIIGVPFEASSVMGGGPDALSACFDLPGGRAIMASAPIHSKERSSLDKAVRMAVFMLTEQQDHEFAAIYAQRLEAKGKEAYDMMIQCGMLPTEMYCLDRLDTEIEGIGLAVHVTDDLYMMQACDDKFSLSVQSVLPKAGLSRQSRYRAFADFALALDHTERTLVTARPVNAAEFMARVIGLDDIKVREALGAMFVDKVMANGPKYGDKYIPIIADSFE